MMGELVLKGKLNLMGNLTLKDKVKVGDKEALVQSIAPAGIPHASSAPPVQMPPPPVGPLDPGPTVWVINSLNQTVVVKDPSKPIIVAGSIVMQGSIPTWPGMVLPSVGNPTVMINFLPINVVNDQAIIFPSGSSVPLDKSGQT